MDAFGDSVNRAVLLYDQNNWINVSPTMDIGFP